MQLGVAMRFRILFVILLISMSFMIKSANALPASIYVIFNGLDAGQVGMGVLPRNYDSLTRKKINSGTVA